jgi:hypothetical protein
MFKKGNIKTTLTGFATLIGAVVSILKGDVNTGVTGIIAGIGLILAKDHE